MALYKTLTELYGQQVLAELERRTPRWVAASTIAKNISASLDDARDTLLLLRERGEVEYKFIPIIYRGVSRYRERFRIKRSPPNLRLIRGSPHPDE